MLPTQRHFKVHEFWIAIAGGTRVLVWCVNLYEWCTHAFASKSNFALLFTYLFINGTQIAKHHFEEVGKKFLRAGAVTDVTLKEIVVADKRMRKQNCRSAKKATSKQKDVMYADCGLENWVMQSEISAHCLPTPIKSIYFGTSNYARF